MGFHDRRFDASTQLKLEIFRGYIREWLPVFLSRKSRNAVGIFDFFCGPGTDAGGTRGSPLIIADELATYLYNPKTPKAEGVELSLHFNDVESTKVQALRDLLAERMANVPCSVEFSIQNFAEAFQSHQPFLQSEDTAALVLLDQCGVSQITDEVFLELSQCPTTDVLFFISSDYIRRFATEPSIQRYFRDLSPEEIKSIPWSVLVKLDHWGSILHLQDRKETLR